MDPILYWNDVALEANRVSHTTGLDGRTHGPTGSSRALAIVHLAMYDAYAGVARANGTAALPPYLPGLPEADASADANCAVAAAAHATLSALHPSQQPYFDQKRTEAGLSGPGMAAGCDYGLMVAQKILQDRQNDPDASDSGYVPPVGRGQHAADPDYEPTPTKPTQPNHGPFYGAQSKGFAITARHELAAPPALDSTDYLRAMKEVRGKGIAPELMGTLPSNAPRRTIDETVIGVYWGYDGAAGLGTPPRLYNQIIRTLAIAKNNSVAQNAKLFALVNVAMGDAGILAWDQKYIHNLWRPVVGVREHDTSMGAHGVGKNDIADESDPYWLPLGAPKSNELHKNFTPPFPAYPSGHATFGAAALHVARLFYGVTNKGADTLFDGLTFVSDEMNGVTRDNKGTVRPRHVRSFPKGLWQMIEENGRSRVYLGVHWIIDAFAVNSSGKMNLAKNIGGVPLGLKIAEDIFARYQQVAMSGGTLSTWQSTVGPRL